MQKRSTRKHSSSSFRPGFEALEERALMSVGPEFHINTETFFNQNEAAVASQPTVGGRTVAVWTSVNEIGSNGQNIRAQLFNGVGGRIGGEIVVAGTRFINEFDPAVAMDAQGNFVVVWTEAASDSPNADTMIRGQRFFANGVKNGGVMTIVNDPFERESQPDVAMDAAGNFVVSYTVTNTPLAFEPLERVTQASSLTVSFPLPDFLRSDTDVVARRFASNGTLLGTIVVGGTTANELFSSIARSPDGRFSIAFQANVPVTGGGFNPDIRLSRFNAAGGLIGTRTISNSVKADVLPDVAMDRHGNTIVVWQHAFSPTDHDILARKVFSSGVAGSIMSIDASTAFERNPTVAMDLSDGDFVVAYNRGTSLFSSIMVREFSSSGTRKNSFNLGPVGSMPALSINDSDVYFMAYTSGNRADDPGEGIRGRRGFLA